MMRRRVGGYDGGLPTTVNEDDPEKKRNQYSLRLLISIIGLAVILVLSLFYSGIFRKDDKINSTGKSWESNRQPVMSSKGSAQPTGSKWDHKFTVDKNNKNQKTGKISNRHTPQKPTPAPVEIRAGSLGNIVLLSYKAHSGSSIVAQILAETFDFTNAMAIFSRRFWDESLGLPGTDFSVADASKTPGLVDAQKQRMINYIRARMSRPAGFRGKVVEIEVTDAWTNGVSLTWLLTSLKEYGGVTHIIKLSRNPVYVEISGESLIPFGRAKEKISMADRDCDDQKHMYEVSGKVAIEQAMNLAKGFTEAARLHTIPQIGFSYELDIMRNLPATLGKIASFLNVSISPHHALLQRTVLPRSCPLSLLLHNYADLHCELGGSPLHWMVQDSDNTINENVSRRQPLNFLDTISSAQAYTSTWMRDGRHEMTQAKCVAKRENQELVPLDLISGRCAHGGHTDICRGHGRVTEFVCRKIFEASGCDVMTYRDSAHGGDCYLHMRGQDDYWVGDCPLPDYHGTLKKPGDVKPLQAVEPVKVKAKVADPSAKPVEPVREAPEKNILQANTAVATKDNETVNN